MSPTLSAVAAPTGRMLASGGWPAAALAELVRGVDGSRATATVLGYGGMGRQYVEALRALGLRAMRVWSRTAERLAPLAGEAGIETVVGSIDDWRLAPRAADELIIIALPYPLLVPAAERATGAGFRRLLIEKPVALTGDAIARLAEAMDRLGADAVCGYNRVAYPSLHELAARAADEGGVTSCAYGFTEMIKPDWPARFPAEELARWGIANSLHPISLAHGLIGWPREWTAHRRGGLPWHPSGSVFVGAGVSVSEIPFTYHADWGSPGRWWVECHTRFASYRCCPIERLWRRALALAEWDEIPLTAAAPSVKAGIVEQVAAMLSEPVRRAVPLPSLRDAAALTQFAEDVFGYDRS